jgi:signal transduction histidine kinase
VLIVADTGPGIAATDRERALQPFVRLHDTRIDSTGSGLGLSLVAAIARLHGAQLDLEDNHPGLRVIFRFPDWAPSPGDRAG